jgi:hypothetical protein
MAEEVLLAVICIMVGAFVLGGIIILRKAEFVLMFNSKRSFTGKFLFLGQKTKDGNIDIKDKRYVVTGVKPYIYHHAILGSLPAYILEENNPSPIDISSIFPVSGLSASAVRKMGRMAAVEKIMEGGKDDFKKILLYLVIGALMGAGIVFALLFMDVISVPIGTCLSNPQVIAAVQNMTRAVPMAYP